MKIAIYGIGGVGGYFGAQLAKNDSLELHFIARGKHGDAIRINGLHIKGAHGEFVVHPASVTDNPTDIGPCDLVLVCVKSWHLEEIAPLIQPMLHDDTMVLPLLNGITAMDILANHIPNKHILGGLCRIVAKIEQPGVIDVKGLEPTIVFGEMNKQRSERVSSLQALFTENNITVEVPDDILLAVWKKFLFIASLSGVGALFGYPVGKLRSDAESRTLLTDCLNEIQALAIKKNVLLTEIHVEKTLAFIDSLEADVTASMQRDIMEGKPSELEAQTGTIVKLCRELGLECPANQLVYDSLLPLENKARGVS